jgi:phosphoenolpyruvate carboxykinase (ATP)
MQIAYTRAVINAALAGKLEEAPLTPDPVFGVLVPKSCAGVASEVLSPRSTWADAAAYDPQARKLARMFVENFAQFESDVPDAVTAAAPKPRLGVFTDERGWSCRIEREGVLGKPHPYSITQEEVRCDACE